MTKILFILCLALFAPSGIAAQAFETTVTIAPPSSGDARYYYVPFEVPSDVESLTISYDYDNKGGENVLDLGLFDSSAVAAENDLKGFRGWSGGRRRTIFISRDEASHGYAAGRLPPGKWRVVFGLYKIAPEGVRVRISIKFNEVSEAARREFEEEKNKTFDFKGERRTAPQSFDGLTWYRGDLHMHTFTSDGNWTVKGLLDFAALGGLDFVGVTDHNTFAHHAEIDALAAGYKNLLVLRGEEVTTYGGHFNVWGLESGALIDFRVTPGDAPALQKIVDGVRRKNLIASINHPTGLCGGCGWSYGDWTQMDSVEIWNGAWDAQDEAALAKWDELLRAGHRVTAIGSSDSHAPPVADASGQTKGDALGSPTTLVGLKKLEAGELFAAIRAGKVWISESPKDYVLEFHARGNKKVGVGESALSRKGKIRLETRAANFPPGAALSLISNGRVLRKETLGKFGGNIDETFAADGDSYFRLEIRDASGRMLAMTNPIFITEK